MASKRPDLICAAATPLRSDLSCDRELLLRHCRAMLARGCDGIALFGTTGEGPCLSVDDRRAGLELLLEAGLAPACLIVGTASASLADAVALTRDAGASGVARVLLMPPFFLRDAATEEGVFRFYAEVIERAGPGLRLLLYNFPAISGVTLSTALVGRLRAAFGEAVHGIKDSGGDWQQTAAYLEAFPQLAVYTGTEVHARRAIVLGAAGTVCGLANVIPEGMRRFLDAAGEEAEHWHGLIEAVDDALCTGPFLPACKAAIGLASGAADWRRVTPPLEGLDEQAVAQLQRALRDVADHHRLPVA